jgi:hypothetical protein
LALRKIPLCPITRAAFGACARACSSAAFHSNKSSDVSAYITHKRAIIHDNSQKWHSYFAPTKESIFRLLKNVQKHQVPYGVKNPC